MCCGVASLGDALIRIRSYKGVGACSKAEVWGSEILLKQKGQWMGIVNMGNQREGIPSDNS